MRFRIIPVSQVHKSNKNLRTIFVTCWRIFFCLKVYLLSLYTLTSRNSFEFKYLLQFTYSLHEKSMMSLVAMKICQFKFFYILCMLCCITSTCLSTEQVCYHCLCMVLYHNVLQKYLYVIL
jgi:hypothetical protein